MAKKNSGFIGGLAVGAVVTLLIGSAITENWLYGDDPTAALQPEAGGMQLVETPATAQPSQPQLATTATATPNPFIAGQSATVSRNVRLYADASNRSLILNLITQGETVTFIPAGDNYPTYPVENDGQLWVRVRAEDGLVGWIDSTALEIG